MDRKKKVRYLVIFSIILSYITYQGLKIQNVFDEMYYNEMNLIKWYTFKTSSFEDIPGIVHWNKKDARGRYDFFGIIWERYSEKHLPENMNGLSITFYFSDNKMSLNIRHYILERLSVNIGLTYWADRKILEREVYIDDRREENKMDSYFIHDEDIVKEYLVEFQIDRDLIESLYQEGIENILIKDWVSVHNSRFSTEYIGRVDIQGDFDKYFD